jgi:hypothetical protein
MISINFIDFLWHFSTKLFSSILDEKQAEIVPELVFSLFIFSLSIIFLVWFFFCEADYIALQYFWVVLQPEKHL